MRRPRSRAARRQRERAKAARRTARAAVKLTPMGGATTALLDVHRVRLEVHIAKKHRKDIAELLLDSLRTHNSRLEPRVNTTDDGLEVLLEVPAEARGDARAKATYALKRAAEKSGRLQWRGMNLLSVEVVDA